MSTYTQILYQIVFSTKYRRPTLTKNNRKELYKCIWGLLKNKNCHTYRIGGIEDHLHIVTHIHPMVALGKLVKDIKLGATSHIKEAKLFADFGGWQGGYDAFTYSIDAKNRLIEYVKNQEQHHQSQTSKEELRALLQEHRIPIDEKYFL